MKATNFRLHAGMIMLFRSSIYAVFMLLLQANPAVSQTSDFSSLDEESQIQILQSMVDRPSASRNYDALRVSVNVWMSANGMTSDTLLATAASVLRKFPEQSAEIRPLLALLPHQSKVWSDRDQLEVIRLRSWLILNLTDVGLANELSSHALDILAHADERSQAIELATAARVIQRCSANITPQIIPHLVRMAGTVVSEEEITLVRYEVDFDKTEATTPQLEAIASLAVICHPSNSSTVRFLQRLANLPQNSRWDPRARIEANKALVQISENGSIK